MADKPKTAEQIDKRLIAGFCLTCKSQIEKDIAKRIFERIDRRRTWTEDEYQQLKKEFLGE